MHECGIPNYYSGSFTSEKEFAVPVTMADYLALQQQIEAFAETARQSGEASAKGAVAAGCPDNCRYKHSFIAAELDEPTCKAEEKHVRGHKFTIWRVKVVVNWIANVTCDDHGPSSDPDATASYQQILGWMPEDKRVQAIANQKHLYSG
jgi:hypothetical protein